MPATIFFAGIAIAKRSEGRWQSLNPDFTVHEDGDALIIELSDAMSDCWVKAQVEAEQEEWLEAQRTGGPRQ
jgi:hypothetical protein